MVSFPGESGMGLGRVGASVQGRGEGRGLGRGSGGFAGREKEGRRGRSFITVNQGKINICTVKNVF